MTWDIRTTKTGNEMGTYIRGRKINRRGGYTAQRGKMVLWWAGMEHGGKTTSPRSAKKMVEKILRSKSL